MNRTWANPLPLDMVCPDCRGALPRGTTWHRCESEPVAAQIAQPVEVVAATPPVAVKLPKLVVPLRCQFVSPAPGGNQCAAPASWTIARHGKKPHPLCDFHSEPVRDLCSPILEASVA